MLPNHFIKGFSYLRVWIEYTLYVMLLDLECDALVVDIFRYLLSSVKIIHSPLLVAHIESILVDILDEADDLLLELLISILYWSQAVGSPLSIAQVISKKVLETCASRISLQQIIIYRWKYAEQGEGRLRTVI